MQHPEHDVDDSGSEGSNLARNSDQKHPEQQDAEKQLRWKFSQVFEASLVTTSQTLCAAESETAREAAELSQVIAEQNHRHSCRLYTQGLHPSRYSKRYPLVPMAACPAR